MKKIIGALLLIVAIFSLTACSEVTNYSQYEQSKGNYAIQLSTSTILPLLGQYMEDSGNMLKLEDFTNAEVEEIYENQMGISVDGIGFKKAVDSFLAAKEEIGSIESYGESSFTISGTTITVTVEVVGALREASAELIFSNDMFLTLENATLNANYSLSEKMASAGQNTLICILVVFSILIFIALIISLFQFIPKIEKAIANRKEKKAEESTIANTGIDNAISQIEAMEEANEVDDLELVAVIAAAIAASTNTSTDDFVVRSIRKVKRA